MELGDQGDLEAIWKLPGGVRAWDANWLPGRLFNSRLAPVARFGVRGAIWYQGESNCEVGEDPRDYQHKMQALVTGWRQALRNDKMPVYFVQLPGSGAGSGWSYLREQQRLAADLPYTGMVVTVDIRERPIREHHQETILGVRDVLELHGSVDRGIGRRDKRLLLQANPLVVKHAHAVPFVRCDDEDGVLHAGPPTQCYQCGPKTVEWPT